jgi:transcriptional regulator with XRE-family HTH domain
LRNHRLAPGRFALKNSIHARATMHCDSSNGSPGAIVAKAWVACSDLLGCDREQRPDRVSVADIRGESAAVSAVVAIVSWKQQGGPVSNEQLALGLVTCPTVTRAGRSARPCERGTDRAPFRRGDGGMLMSMDALNDIAEFLTSRRARVTPEQAGLPTWGPRRVKGLRREEVASLAGVSVEYYKRLERGNASGVSEGVLEALSRALQLDDAERAHLFDLARAASPSAPRGRRGVQQRVRPAVLRILDSIAAPAIVRNGRVDYLAANPLGRALYAPIFDSREQPPNSGRFVFLDPAAREFYVDWERHAKDLVAHLRSEAGRNPYDRVLSDLVGELSTRSPEFGSLWAAHNVRYHQTGIKRLHHPVVGELELDYEVMEISADDGLTIGCYSAEPGSGSAQALDLLASWAATPEPSPTTSPESP